MPLASYTNGFQCESGKHETFHFVRWFFWSGYYPLISPHNSSNQMDVHPWEERISSYLDVQSLCDSAIIMLILWWYYCRKMIITEWDWKSTFIIAISYPTFTLKWMYFCMWKTRRKRNYTTTPVLLCLYRIPHRWVHLFFISSTELCI